MRWIAALLAFLVASAGVSMAAPAFVQGLADSGTGTSVPFTLPSAVTAGDFLIAFIETANTAASSISVTAADNLNGAWTADGPVCFDQYNGQANAFYLPNAAAGSTTVTFTLASSQTVRVAIMEFSGVASSGALDVPATCTIGYASSITTADITTTAPGDLVLAAPNFGGNGGTFTVSSGWTLLQANGTAAAYQVAPSAGAVTGATFTIQYGPGSVLGMTTAFKAAGTPPASSPTQFGLFMVGP